jgi:regulatory protein
LIVPLFSPPSLKSQALRFLAMREHSRRELFEKLGRYCDDASAIEALLEDFSAKGLLSNERFVHSVIARKSSRFGALRIEQELRRHSIDKDLLCPAIKELQETEFMRAQSVWRNRFPTPPTTPNQRAKQARFMQGRGFGPDVIRRLLANGLDSDD